MYVNIVQIMKYDSLKYNLTILFNCFICFDKQGDVESGKDFATSKGSEGPEKPIEDEINAPEGSKGPEGLERSKRSEGPERPRRPEEVSIQQRFNVFYGDRRKPGTTRRNPYIGSNHTTCGNGRGLLSVYEIGYRSTLLFKHNKHQRSRSPVELNNQLVLIASLLLTVSSCCNFYLHL